MATQTAQVTAILEQINQRIAIANGHETGDTCRQFPPDAELAAADAAVDAIAEPDAGAEIKSRYQNLNRQIVRSADKYDVKAQDAAASWDTLMPLVDRMQAMLSQRGEQRELMDTLGLPSWTDWFKEFRPRLKEVTLRTIQRKIAEYRGKKPVKRNTRKKYDAVDIAHLEKVALAAQQLAEDDIDNSAYNPIREAIARKPDGGELAVQGHDVARIQTPVHTQIAHLALQLANSVLNYKGVPEFCAMLAHQIVDLMTTRSSSPPAAAAVEAPTSQEPRAPRRKANAQEHKLTPTPFESPAERIPTNL